MARDALIIIDMLNDFVNEDGALFVGATVKNLVPEIQKKIAKYREDRRPILYLCDNHDENDKEFEMFPKHAVAGAKGAEIHKDLRPQPEDIIIPKTRFSCFYGTELADVLAEKEIDTIEIAGVCTHICVLYTCEDARNRGMNVIVDRRCVDTFDRAAHEFALKEMDRTLGAKII